MTAETTRPTAAPHLRRGALGLPQVVFQGITHIAPSINIVFTFPIIALKAGPAMPISFLLTTIVCYFIGNTVSQFSKYMPSSGGYYSFATRGLGDRSGFMTTWSYLIYDIGGPAGAIGFLGYLISNTIQTASGVDIPWWIFALAIFAVVWALTHFGIRLSMRTTAVFGAIEILIMLALAITFLVHPGHGSSYTAPLQPSHAPHMFGGILAGMVFSVLALSGFEAPAPLAQETRRPGKLHRPRRHALAVPDRRLLHLYVLRQCHRLGHRQHGGLRLAARTRTTHSATRCGAPAGGSSSSPSSTAPSASGWPARTPPPG